MPKRVYALIAVVVAVLGLALAQPAVSAAAPVRIMPLGDSITAGPGCWRALLWDRLQRTGYPNIDFVGSQPGGGCSVPFDGDHEGHGGYAATGIADQNQLPAWLAASRPDVVLMHLGTNDLWGGTIGTDAILAAYSKLVDQMRASNPDMKILVAQLIPMEPGGCAACAQRVVALNTAIPGWAAAKTTTRSPITVVDQWTGFSAAADTSDGVHPIDPGFRKMADRWYPALAAALGTPVPPSSTTTTTTSPPTGTCTATYRVTGQWTGGFQAEVSIRNDASATASAWTATFGLAADQRISQAWNATVTQDGAAVTARNADWNGTLGTGASATFGFLASGSGTGAIPAVSCAVR
ncbi:cellulose binding domain-containing protein [Amycolatopsis sp. lyj-346]|uniref:cellulose binding domain-containing protein n=1 Tax=Amycolatopsis sp. lyj-346 TaxID=2789289 RepID=UPI00397E035A